MSQYLSAVQQEKDDAEFFNQTISNNLDVWQRLWKYGDGDGGFVIDSMRKAFCTESEPVSRMSYRKKKKITHDLRTKVFERDLYRCNNCGTHLDLTVDHIIPESRGGTLDFCNLQTLCRSCNSKKGTKIND